VYQIYDVLENFILLRNIWAWRNLWKVSCRKF